MTGPTLVVDNESDDGPICFPEPEYRTPPEHPDMLGVRFVCEKCEGVGEPVYGPPAQVAEMTRKARELFCASVGCEIVKP